ncbi:menorin-like [Glandiceps talaboti]
MMLEADISPENNTGIPIMAHPPDVTSDITLEEWINKTIHTDKGMKLDFKDITVLEASLNIAKSFENEIHQPLWYNADIVHGPNSPRDPIPPVEFIDTINNIFPDAILSLGWTTEWAATADDDLYTWTMIFDNMFYSYQCVQPVTFPIRAVWSVTSWEKFVWMLGVRDDFSITVWSSSNDDVNVDGLVDLRLHGDIERIYYDLPDSQMQEFKDALEEITPSPDPVSDNYWDKNLWTGIESGAIGDYVYLSTTGAGVVGSNHGAFIETIDEYEPNKGVDVVEVSGKVQFVYRVGESTYKVQDGVELYIRSSGISNLKVIQDGIRLYIGRDGKIQLESVASGSDPVSETLDPSDCYSFKVLDKGSNSAVTAEVAPAECSDGTGSVPTSTKAVTLSLKEPYEKKFYIVMAKTGSDIDVFIEDVILPSSSSRILCSTLTLVLSLLITMVKLY